MKSVCRNIYVDLNEKQKIYINYFLVLFIHFIHYIILSIAIAEN